MTCGGDDTGKEIINTIPTVIGWREWACFPNLGVEKIIAKIDTGAQSSALHAFNINEIESDDKCFVKFSLHPLQRKKIPELLCQAPVIGRRSIRSSNGFSENRYLIETQLRLGRWRWTIELTLTNRECMDYRLLLGRDAIQKKFIVDPNASYLLDVAT